MLTLMNGMLRVKAFDIESKHASHVFTYAFVKNTIMFNGTMK